MKKFLTILLSAVMLATVLSIGVSAVAMRDENGIVYKLHNIDMLNGDEINIVTGDPEEDKAILYHTTHYGWLTMYDGYACFMTSMFRNQYEAIFWDPAWAIPVEFHWIKIRYKVLAPVGEFECKYFLSGNHQCFSFPVYGDGEWHEEIIDATKIEGIDWLGYVDDGWEYSCVPAGTPIMRSFDFEFNYYPEEIGVLIDYTGFFKTEEAARNFNGTMEDPIDITGDEYGPYELREAKGGATEAATEAATEDVTPSAPQTADIALILMAIGATSGALVLKNRKNRK